MADKVTLMSDNPQDLVQVETLLQERDSVHGWLSKLDSSNSNIPEAVKARVRADYQSRLEGITAELGTHADAVAQKLVVDRTERDELLALMETAREAVAEVELRHAVGEYDSERFESELTSHSADLDSFEVSINAVTQRIERLEGVEALIGRVPAAVVDQQTDAIAAVESESELEPSIEELAPDPDGFLAPLDEVVPSAGSDVPIVEEQVASELPLANEPLAKSDSATEELLSVFGESMTIEPGDLPEQEPEDLSASPLQLDEVPDQPPVAEDEVRVADYGPLSFTPPGDDLASSSRPAPPPMGMPSTDQVPRFVRPGNERGSELSEVEIAAKKEAGVTKGSSAGPATAEEDESVASDTGATPKTLRCGECGAMNRPLEWYCEKCGAELSAV